MKHFLFILVVLAIVTSILAGCEPFPPDPVTSPLCAVSPLKAEDAHKISFPPKTGGTIVNFNDAVVNGIPILLLIIGLVEYSKKFGAKDLVCDIESMGFGIIFGVLYQVTSVKVPSTLGEWFGVILYGLGLGLTASGLWAAILKKPKT